jgi:hypothetical protein
LTFVAADGRGTALCQDDPAIVLTNRHKISGPFASIAPASAFNLDCLRSRIGTDRTDSLQGAEPPIASAQLQYSPHLATAVPYQDPYQLSPILFESAHRFPFDHAPCARPSNGPSPEPAMGQLRQHNRYGYDGCAQQQC